MGTHAVFLGTFGYLEIILGTFGYLVAFLGTFSHAQKKRKDLVYFGVIFFLEGEGGVLVVLDVFGFWGCFECWLREFNNISSSFSSHVQLPVKF